MELIDDDGDLFGVVNVIDALAVLLVIAVLIAGAALLGFIGTQPTEETRYVTIDLGEQPAYVAEQIDEGDVMAPADTDGNLTLTDVYVTPVDNETVTVTIRAEVEGSLAESDQRAGKIFEYHGNVMRPGVTMTVDTTEYELEGTVVSMASDGRSLDTVSKAVTLETTVSPSTARQVAAGDTFDIGGQTVAEVTAVHVAPGPGDDTRTLTLGLELDAIDRGGSVHFAGKPLDLNRTIRLDVGDSRFEGTVTALDTDELSVSERTVTLRATLSAETARQLRSGDTYEIAGEPVATIDSVTVYPTTEPATRRVVLEVRLRTITQDGVEKFGSRPVRLGEWIPFETEAYDFSGKVIARDSLSEVAETKTITAVVKLENVSPEQVDVLEAGMTERIDGSTNARVVDKRTEPAVTILTSQDGNIYEREHPRNKDVYLTVELEVRDMGNGLYFHGKRLKYGDDVVFDFRTVVVRGTVIDIDE